MIVRLVYVKTSVLAILGEMGKPLLAAELRAEALAGLRAAGRDSAASLLEAHPARLLGVAPLWIALQYQSA